MSERPDSKRAKVMVNMIILKFQHAPKSSGEFLKHNLLDLTLQISDSVGLRWNLINCIVNKLSFDTDAGSLKSQLENH